MKKHLPYIIFIQIVTYAFPSLVFACGEKEKPILLVELDGLGVSETYCTDYDFIMPKTFKDTNLLGIGLQHGEGIDMLQFSLNFYENQREDQTMTAHLCAKPEWLSQAEISLSYKSPPVDGWTIGCHDSFKYQKVNELATKSTCKTVGCCRTSECVLERRK